MNDPESQNIWLTRLLVGALPIFFAIVWCSVMTLLSRLGGWHALGRRFRIETKPEGDTIAEKHTMQRGRIGSVTYNNCLSVQISGSGVRLAVFPLFRLGHPPLLIPWREVHDLREIKLLFGKACEFKVGDPTIAQIVLPHKVLEAALRLVEKGREENT